MHDRGARVNAQGPRAGAQEVFVSAYAVHLPGEGVPGDPLLALVAGEPAVDPDEAHLLLGRKGMLFKEPSTRLALLAVHRALGLAPGRPKEPIPGAARTAVVVSSNLGNVATVAQVVRDVRAGSGRDVSILQGPNASSNVIASTVAIRFGFTGPNLMVCSGATSGLDAVRLGRLLLGSGRADRVVVVGVEPDDDTATGLAGELRALAACVVLEREPTSGAGVDAGGGVALGRVYKHDEPLLDSGSDGLTLRAEDLDHRLGRTDGALGVLQVALATAWLQAGEALGPVRITCGSPEDGYATARLMMPDRGA